MDIAKTKVINSIDIAKANISMAKDTAKNNIGNLRNRCREIITGDEKMRIRNLLEEKRTEPVYVKYFDKLAFTIGVLNLFAMEFFLLNIPEHYWMFYLTTLCPLLSYRCVYFYRFVFLDRFMLCRDSFVYDPRMFFPCGRNYSKSAIYILKWAPSFRHYRLGQ